MGFLGDKLSEIGPEEILSDNNIFEGIKCVVEFPNQQLKIGTSSGFAKGAATLAFGLVGLAATSGIKHSEEKRKLETIFQVVDNGIVFKQATMNSEDLRIPYNNIVSAHAINNHSLKIRLLKNQEITILNIRLARIPGDLNLKIHLINHIVNVINERACGTQYEESGWGLEHATAEPQETKQESGSLMDELERLGNMYEKGLLTDDEFVAMKNQLIKR